MEKWVPLPLDKPLFANLDEDAVVGHVTALENAYQNELGGLSRFPGLVERASLGGRAKVYLHDFDGDLIAATSQGQAYRLDRNFNVTNVTAVPVAGGRRVIFAKTDRDLLMAAGGPIVRLRNATTEVLSKDAPAATHIGFIDNFIIAVEINSGRFFHCTAGEPDVWNPLDTFSADGNPDNINSFIITPFRELIMGGDDSIEQFERLTTGDVPFFRRWAVGEGVKLPYASVFADNGVFTIGQFSQLVHFRGQRPDSVSDAVQLLLEKIDDWSEAWIGGFPDRSLHAVGQEFVVLQIPNATSPYGTKGITLCYDIGKKRFFSLYGWDEKLALPARWPGWSHWRLWDRTFVGGEGKIYELTDATHVNGDQRQRWLVRTSHMSSGNALQINKFRLQVRRGMGPSNITAPTIMVRCSRDGRAFGPWIKRTLGKSGERLQMIEFGHFGTGSTFMFEICCTDDTPVDLIRAEVTQMPIGH